MFQSISAILIANLKTKTLQPSFPAQVKLSFHVTPEKEEPAFLQAAASQGRNSRMMERTRKLHKGWIIGRESALSGFEILNDSREHYGSGASVA